MTTYCENCLDTLSESLANDQTEEELLQLKVRGHINLVMFYQDFSNVNTSIEYYYCKACNKKYVETNGRVFDKPFYRFEEVIKPKKELEEILKNTLSQYLYLEKQLESIQNNFDFSKPNKLTVYRLIGTNKRMMLEGKSSLEILQKFGYNMTFDSPVMQNVHFSLENLVEQEEFNKRVAQSLYIIKFEVPLNEMELSIQTNYLYPTIEVISDYKVPPANITVMATLNDHKGTNLDEFDMNGKRENQFTFYNEFMDAKENLFKQNGRYETLEELKSSIQF